MTIDADLVTRDCLLQDGAPHKDFVCQDNTQHCTYYCNTSFCNQKYPAGMTRALLMSLVVTI